jgi:hypothetical protein
MREEKQIEEMAKIACVGFRDGDCENCITHGRSKSMQITRPPQSWCYVERSEI